MARAFGLDLRRRVVEAMDDGLSSRQAAARFSVGISTAVKWHLRWREERSLEPGRQGKPKRSKLDEHEAFILGLVEERRDIALHEIAGQLFAERGLQTCPATVWYFFSRRGLTHKKRQAMPPSSSVRMFSRDAGPGSKAKSISSPSG